MPNGWMDWLKQLLREGESAVGLGGTAGTTQADVLRDPESADVMKAYASLTQPIGGPDPEAVDVASKLTQEAMPGFWGTMGEAAPYLAAAGLTGLGALMSKDKGGGQKTPPVMATIPGPARIGITARSLAVPFCCNTSTY